MKHKTRRIIQLIVMVLGLTVSSGEYHHTLAQSPQVSTRVIIVLHPPDAGAEVNIQVEQVAQAQEKVLSEVSPAEVHLLHQYQTLPGMVAEVTETGLETLRNQPEVVAITPDIPVEAALSESAAFINIPAVWRDFGLTGTGVNVAVLDTGVDLNHPDLTDTVIAQHCFNKNGCLPDEAIESDNAQDEYGHGTHIAGIIASQGQMGPSGLAPDVGLVAVRVLGQGGSGFSSDVLSGMDWLLANQANLKVKVINLSLGGGSYEGVCDQENALTMLYATAVEAARQAGITIFAASGNGGQPEAMMAPACISGVISVGNVYDTPLNSLSWGMCSDTDIEPDQVACSSNSNPELDLLAPGVLINTAHLGGGQSSGSGTSLSTAHASAVAALLLQANPSLTPAELETILEETGVPVTDSRNGMTTPRLEALAAVSRVTGHEVTIISGTVLLQGRANHNGTDIFLSEAPCATASPDIPIATTGDDGRFEINIATAKNYQCLQAVQSGYLSGQYDTPAGDLGSITLPGGDVTGDGLIDIFDLVFIATRYQSNDPTADIDTSGQVDILDLVIVANNYDQTGPVNNWQ